MQKMSQQNIFEKRNNHAELKFVLFDLVQNHVFVL
jgi:hypothetical protein